MKIIIGGAGNVGASIIGYLTQGSNDIVVIDNNSKNLDEISKNWDVRPILGSVSHPGILKSANAGGTDLLLAVTDSDEVNIVACQLAHTLFDIPEKIARLDNEEFFSPDWADLYNRSNSPMDLIISPDISIASAVYNLIKLPGALENLVLCNENLKLVGLHCGKKCPLIKTPLGQLSLLAPELDVSFVNIIRGGTSFVPRDEDILNDGDDVYFLVEKTKLYDAIHAFDLDKPMVERVVIFGGGRVALNLARKLERDDNILSIKIVESDAKEARYLAKYLNRTSVINGEFMNDAIIQEAGVENADVAVSITESDKDNMLFPLLAKSLGASSTISLINSRAYTSLLDTPDNVWVDRSSVTISNILKEIRKARIVKAYSLGRGFGEIWEVKITENSKLLEKKLSSLKMPPNSKICALYRDENISFPPPDEKIRLDDRFVVYVGADAVKKAEKLFS